VSHAVGPGCTPEELWPPLMMGEVDFGSATQGWGIGLNPTGSACCTRPTASGEGRPCSAPSPIGVARLRAPRRQSACRSAARSGFRPLCPKGSRVRPPPQADWRSTALRRAARGGRTSVAGAALPSETAWSRGLAFGGSGEGRADAHPASGPVSRPSVPAPLKSGPRHPTFLRDPHYGSRVAMDAAHRGTAVTGHRRGPDRGHPSAAGSDAIVW